MDSPPGLEDRETESGAAAATNDSNAAAPAPEEDPAAPVSASDDLSSTDDDDDSSGDNNNNNQEDALMQAALLKEEGNGHFQKGNWDDAARCYRKGCNRLKKVSNVDADPQVKPLQLTLQTNLSMVLFKQRKYRASRDVAAKALELDGQHVKALYRRAVACRKLGDWEQSRADLRAALVVDSTNVACKKELAAVKKQIDAATQQQKSALAKAFSSKNSSSLLYNDKEEEERQRRLEKEQQAKKKEEEKQARKQQWEDECVSRMAKGGEAISFEEWEKEREKEEKAKKDKEEKERKEAERQRKAARKAAKKAKQQEEDDDYDTEDELTAQELASLRGYKKTKDGRTTSYFTRELSEEERQRMGDMAPKKLETNHQQNTSSSSNSSPTAVTASSTAGSAWNQAGTWEEKDCTTWCKESLNSALETTHTSADSLSAKIKSVEDLTGEGSVATTGGKKRYIFDFHAKLKYHIGRDGKKLASGVVRLPDICSTHYDDDELEVTFESSWSKEPPASDAEACVRVRDQLAAALRSSVQQWVQSFNQQF